ncbi:hypothetical protein [Sphaerisporangium aureirubrum]|uniref:DUF5753 domain-containing protein n=1 Tax=Sphaerisporangium aureirubrum TaxID=1544736 RepID=A0ABW1NHY9_9ACTN
MPRLWKPGGPLPAAGPQLELTQLLRALHRDAGLPSNPDISKAAERLCSQNRRLVPVGRERVRQVLNGERASWKITEIIALALADLAKKNEPALLNRIREMWLAAHLEDAAPFDMCGEPSDLGVVLDIGTAEPPNYVIPEAEIRFSLTNETPAVIKVISIVLSVIGRDIHLATVGTTVAAPLDETLLSARLDDRLQPVELLAQHHLIPQDTSDGFFLKLAAPDGYVYDLELRARWKHLGVPRLRQVHERFTLPYPAASVEGLLRVARHAARLRGDDDAPGSCHHPP